MSKAERQRKWMDMMRIHHKRLLVKDWENLADRVGYWVLGVFTALFLWVGIYKILFG